MAKILKYNNRKYQFKQARDGTSVFLFTETDKDTWQMVDKFPNTKSMMDYIYRQKTQDA